jgi:hypothetical protein
MAFEISFDFEEPTYKIIGYGETGVVWFLWIGIASVASSFPQPLWGALSQ